MEAKVYPGKSKNIQGAPRRFIYRVYQFIQFSYLKQTKMKFKIKTTQHLLQIACSPVTAEQAYKDGEITKSEWDQLKRYFYFKKQMAKLKK